MEKYKTLGYKVSARIARKNDKVFVREDFQDLGGYDQIGRILRELIADEKLVKLGYGLYAKTKRSKLTGDIIPVAPLPTLAREVLAKLGIRTAPTLLENAYSEGKINQVPTGRRIAIWGRFSRKISYKGAEITYEPLAR